MTAPLVASRARLAAERDRDYVYLSAADGSLSTAWTANGQPIPRVPLSAHDNGFYGAYDANYHGAVFLPPGTPPGPLTLNCGRGPELTLSVAPAPQRPGFSVPAGCSAQNLQILLNAGKREIYFAPGQYVWDSFPVLPADTILHGYGASIRRLPINPYGQQYPCFYVGGPNVTLNGFEFVYDVPSQVIAANPAALGLVVADCSFRRCSLGWYFADALIRDCEFRGGGSIIAPSGLWLRPRFLGLSLIDPFQFWGPGSVQMIDGLFDKTSRGPVFNAGGGPINDCLFVGTECHGIVRGNNGNECWLCEGGELNRLCCLHTRIVGCESAAFQFNDGGDAAVVRDLLIRNGLGPLIGQNSAMPVTNFTLRDFQVPALYCGTAARGFQGIDGRVIGFMPTRGNQDYANVAPLLDSRTIAAWNEGDPGNSLSNVNVIGTPAGMIDQKGFTMQGVSP